MRRAVIAVCFLAGCNHIPSDLVNEATQREMDRQCVAALAHAKECDARFPDRTILCSFSADGQCAPYINAEQSLCLRDSPCENVRAALDQGHWLCGVSLAPGPTARP
jgi:hypothetical protein